MLTPEIKSQLKEHFKPISSTITLAIQQCSHEKQHELLEMLEGIADCSDKITVKQQDTNSDVPEFSILRDNQEVGITFKGIPGGHEFSSLVLAILNSALIGKFPDDRIQDRIKAIKGPVDLQTYISLSCTNCPDVVQTLNLFAVINPGLRHTMIDGGLVEETINKLNVQAVPAVFAGENRIHVGKGGLPELLDALEKNFEKAELEQKTTEPKHFDVAVIGGGPAGASAAIYTARKGLNTAVIAQHFGGQVRETKGIENFIGTPYTEGKNLVDDLAKHLKEYPIKLFESRKVTSLEAGKEKHTVKTVDGEVFTATRIIVCTGAQWRKLGIPGEKEYSGRGVAYCPHCDGPFYKGKSVAVIGGGNSGVEAAIDLSNICKEVHLFEFMDTLKADNVLVKKAESLTNTTITTSAKVHTIQGDENSVTKLKYQDRATEKEHQLDIDGVFVQIGLSPNSDCVKEVLKLNKFGEIHVDEHNRTNVPGIYAAGDVTTVPFKQIIISMGEGAKAALSAFEDSLKAES